MFQRKKKLSKDTDVTAKILEEIHAEISENIPTEDDYRVVRTQKKVVTNVIPTNLRHGEFIIDEVNNRLAVRIGKKMYKVDLTEIT